MIVAHDLGTSGDKAVLCDDDGVILASVTASYPADFGNDGRAEQDPGAWWDAFCRANRSLLAQTGSRPTDVDAVSFSGQMMGVVPLDSSGQPVRPAIIWADTRSDAQCRTLTERIGLEAAYRTVGHRLNPTYSLSKIMWLRDTEPDTFDRVRTVIQAKDYLVHRLTGTVVTDPSDASGTNAYDQNAGTWSTELIAAAGLPSGLFPEIVPSTTVVGTVNPEAARECALSDRTRVVAGGGDGPMAALGAGIIDRDSGAYAYLGSSSWVSIAADRPLHDPLMRSMTFNHVIPGRFVPTATMQTGGAALSWAVGVFGHDTQGPDDGYADLLAQAERSTAADDGLFFLPYLLGERSPYWNPDARGAFLGLHMSHTRGNMVRAVLEGVGYNLYSGVNAFTDGGVDIHSMDVIGGAANATFFLQILADIWGVPLSRRSLVDEANAIGAAVVAGVGIGLFADFAVARRLSTRSHEHRPSELAHQRHARNYERFVDAYTRLEAWFAHRK